MWKTNLERIEIHNKQEKEGYQTFRMKMNAFGDIVRIKINSNLNKQPLIFFDKKITNKVDFRYSNFK